ncbi:MAG: serine/threonine-protein kinase [Nannocystaceae bacterium]|nr:serine/threonine-protein kinase [Nannocystaceae bacterium]
MSADDAVAAAMAAGRPDEAAVAAALRAVQARLFPTVPQRVGRYLLLDELGRGGMGVVFRGYDPELDRRVAVKLVPDHGDAAALKREAQALARLSHRNVVPVHDVGDTGGAHAGVYIVMELIEGVTLDRWLGSETRGLAEITAMFIKAARGLAAAHAAGVIHRDFKPSNVVVDAEGEPRVLDFGIAALGEAEHRDHSSVRGTLPFMSPELMRGEPVDARSDQYALAVAMYRAVGGVFPFPAEQADDSLALKLRGALTPMTRPCPAPLQAALARALRADPAERFASLHDWIAAVGTATARRPGRWIAATAVTITVATAIAVDARHDARRRACREDPSAAAWDDDTRARLRDELVARHGDTGARAFAAVDADLVGVRDGIVEARASLCEAQIDGAVEAAIASQRERCLDGVATELAAFAAVIAAAPTLHVTGELLVLPDAHSCEHPLQDATADEALTSLVQSFGAVEALLRLGRLADAEARLQEQQANLARAAPGLRVRALLLQAKLWRHRGDREHATELAFAALRLAEQESLPTLATHAMLRLVDALGAGAATDPSRRADAERWLALAQQRLDHGDAPMWLVDFAAAERVDLLRTRVGPEAIAAARELLALRSARLGDHHLATATAHDGLGAALTEAGQLDEGGAELSLALAMRSEQLGAEHPSVARSLNNVAMNAVLAGRPAVAIERLTRALAIDEATGEVGSPYWLRRALNRVDAAVGSHLGDPIAWAREALDELAGEHCDHSECASLHLLLARALLEQDAAALALEELGAALAILEDVPAHESLRRDVDAQVTAASHPGAPRRDAER